MRTADCNTVAAPSCSSCGCCIMAAAVRGATLSSFTEWTKRETVSVTSKPSFTSSSVKFVKTETERPPTATI